ncbi:DUF695 domain-containing protein [Tenacibaculum sp. M341]|uniref:DUF695 domain-containing protein n=1 Tax=Tenacibaculum sp. M341 TaxID=2530339 RepID=UPI0010511030|nr:DUF695 domain-containing protein [Tenacibaculum sp. M341]TCI85881.1 DUF695 domain-containing protein [Tenacibaculum sp. M341]
MSFFKKIFSKKEEPIETYQDFWNWFLIHEKKFYEVVNSGDTTRLTSEFFDVIGPKLDQIKKGIFYLSGMLDDNTADLILTPDGNVSNFYLIEELIAESPTLPNWKFQAFKPSFDFGNEGIEMHNYKFNKNNLHFYPNEDTAYPDDISITFVHDDLEEENKSEVINGCYIFLDNYLGELKFATLIDNIEFKSKTEAEKELISLEKLDSYITWREKEFVEKYEGLRRDTEKDSYGSFETTLKNGSPFMAIMNTELLQWDAKASHPWILRLKFPYEGAENNGFPNSETYDLLNKVEDELMEHLKDFDGYLNIGRETGDNLREVYFACKDYRKPCKTIDNLIKKYRGVLEFEYNIYKDKYWKYFDYYIKQA